MEDKNIFSQHEQLRDKIKSLESKLALAVEALDNISIFNHAEDCTSKAAPVYECNCYEKEQWEMASEALAKIKEE